MDMSMLIRACLLIMIVDSLPTTLWIASILLIRLLRLLVAAFSLVGLVRSVLTLIYFFFLVLGKLSLEAFTWLIIKLLFYVL